MPKRRTFTAMFKARVAMEALRGDPALRRISGAYASSALRQDPAPYTDSDPT